ncbi:ribose-phosphate diphosphokinase [Shouchella clausii]|uniref:ribose-phosphate diphosphokinase n=2 Tax=Shouchella clausii TaxID=79880 RepID=UPI000B978A26|nr:ribose-phosphate pyrophosphokinase [Shouchella clausii]AST96647.1 ribose-phosphate pyrophosphokinase [Shouchella clausii]MEB5473587.1 ribose-phosphate pyrophosphokinase [Shouchella clausii]PTL21716.1 ribose-phosphate pyrophosphokinase [Shouchella clausii]QNM43002.1 ribose-phosphate pyrophosphokinase [Shouchella clausii]
MHVGYSIDKKKFKLFTVRSNPLLTNEIASLLGCAIGKSSVKRFSDGEVQINIEESVRGSEVFVVQSTSQPGNEHVMELLIMIDALKRASAKEINVVIPYFGYARQDRKARAREPIAAKLVANLLETAGADRILTVDLHAPQIQGFFNIPVDPLQGLPLLARYFQNKALQQPVIVAPNHSGLGRARRLAEYLDAPIAFIDKRHPEPGFPQAVNIVGDTEGREAIIVDDLIDTAATVTLAANALQENKVSAIYACCTHPVLTGPAIERLQMAPIKEIVVTNTIELDDDKKVGNLTVLSIAPLLAEAIYRVHREQSVSTLFQ